MFTRNDLMDIAVRMERNGEAVYIKALDKVKNPELKSVLRWMADEEASHRKWFRNQKQQVQPGEKARDLEQMLPDVIKEMMGGKSLSLDEVDFTQITNTTQMLETFAGFESDTILFYELLDAFIDDPEAKNGLGRVIREEKAHAAKLREMIQAVAGREMIEETFCF